MVKPLLLLLPLIAGAVVCPLAAMLNTLNGGTRYDLALLKEEIKKLVFELKKRNYPHA